MRSSRSQPLSLYPAVSRDPHYAATIRALAAAVVQTGGIGRIERGTSAFSARTVNPRSLTSAKPPSTAIFSGVSAKPLR